MIRWICFAIFFFTAIAMSNHMLSGFKNLLVFDKVQFSPDSSPFSMYLNFDKTAIGVFIYLFFLKNQNQKISERKNFNSAMMTLGLLVASILPLALGTHYVKFDPKVPTGAWLWIFNNLFFVSFAEESLFEDLFKADCQSSFLARPFGNGCH